MLSFKSEGQTLTTSDWLSLIRPPTLLTGLAPVLVGIGQAVYQSSAHGGWAFFCVVSVVILQSFANAENDIHDGAVGGDSEHRLGPHRLTAAGKLSRRQRKLIRLFFAASAAAILVGLWWRGGVLLGAAWAAALASIFLYSPLISRKGLGEIWAFIFFGPFAVGLTYLLTTAGTAPAAWAYGLAPGMASALMMAINNTRDLAEDQKEGKKTVAVRFGPVGARRLCFALALGTGSCWAILGWSFERPMVAYLALPWLLFLFASFSLPRSFPWQSGQRHNRLLALSGVFNFVTCFGFWCLCLLQR